MGFVYSLDRIHAGRIPRLEAFARLRERITAAMRESPFVVSGSVFGSAARSDVTARSDLDLFVVYRTDARREARRLLRKIRAETRAEHIVLNHRIHSLEEVEAARHRFGPSYRGTFLRLRDLGLLVGEPEIFYRSLHSHDVREEMVRKLRRYGLKTRLQLARFLEWRRGPFWLDRYLEYCWERNIRPAHLYVNLSRHLLLWRDGALPNDGKKTVVRQVLAASEFAPLHADIEVVDELNAEYEALLAAARRGKLDDQCYRRGVRNILAELLAANVRLLADARAVTSDRCSANAA